MSLSMRDFVLVMLVTTLWGVHIPIMKLGVNTIEPLSLNFIRFFLTALVFLPFAGKISFSDLKKLLPISLFFVCANLMFSNLALDYISGNSFVILVQIAQPMTIILAWMLFGEKFGIYTATGIAIAFSGLLIVFGAPDLSAAPLGGLLTVLAGIGWSIGSLAMKKTGHIKPAAFLAYAYLMATPISFAGTYFLESNQVERVLEADMMALGFVIFYQVVVMAAMSFVWAGLMARNSAQFVTPFLMLQPIFAMVGGYFINGEVLNWNILLGGLLTITGIGIITLRRIQKGNVIKINTPD